jgi:mRNA interferase RelE/StbE
MSLYRVVLSKSAEKELSKLPSRVVEKIIPALTSLAENPRPAGCKKLKGFDDLWRIRVGDYRAVYAIGDEILLVEVRSVGHRKEVYE